MLAQVTLTTITRMIARRYTLSQRRDRPTSPRVMITSGCVLRLSSSAGAALIEVSALMVGGFPVTRDTLE
jgi:hypothetical protein